ncbi:MAG TPA: DUF357 domain-containing protein [Methanospirillum sp.]|nr:DUF357 domain-containing protein [Methanospirillum sp.]
MIQSEEWTGYNTHLTESFQTLSIPWKQKTPLSIVGSDIYEMIGSYLSDASVFCTKNDVVNAYASLTYAHGWLDAGGHLGFLSVIESPVLFLPKDETIPSFHLEKFAEKSIRYRRMLKQACDSVEISPVRGSPMHEAAQTIITCAGDACLFDFFAEGIFRYATALGRYSYGYGWLDTGVRAGLLRISANPELFTTEM